MTDPNTQQQTTTYSHSFCLSFYNASTSRTQTGMNTWYPYSVSCSGSGGSPNLVTCNFSGSGQTPASHTIPAKPIFNDYTGNSRLGLVFDTTPGSASAQILPNIQAEPVQPTITMKYKALSVVENVQTAQFRSDAPLQAGFWYLSGMSKSVLKEGGSYGTSRYFYVVMP